jgi:predicted SprT family Zn-dependent metalloprotease
MKKQPHHATTPMPLERNPGNTLDIDRTINQFLNSLGNDDPTTHFYTALRQLFVIVNHVLWENKLPDNVLLAVNVRRGAVGHYASARWQHKTGDCADEIAFNGAYLRQEGGLQFIQTFVHECCHHWQFHFGKPGKRGYHNKEFAAEMRRVGLEPINVGAGPGKDTGTRVSDRIIEGGGVELLYQHLITAGFEVTWAHAMQRTSQSPDEDGSIRQKKRASKTSYICPCCDVRAWAKPDVKLVCGTCAMDLQQVKE